MPGKVKLTAAKVNEIRRLYRTGRTTQQALGAVHGVHQMTISAIVRNVTHPDPDYDPPPIQRRLTTAEVGEIKLARASGETTINLSARYGVSPSTISYVSGAASRRVE